MHRIDEGDGIFDGRLLDDAVAEVEDVAGAAGGLIEDVLGAAADFVAVGQEHERIEVALHRPVVADGFPGVVQPHAPVDADHRGRRLRPEAAAGPGCRWRS